MKISKLCLIALLSVALTGCAFGGAASEPKTMDANAPADIGSSLTVSPPGSGFVPVNQMDTLSADGLYYASWGAGTPEPFENSEGNTIDLYDASLYLLLSENQSEEKAQSSAAVWLAAAENNYDIQSRKTETIGNIDYTVIQYRCVSEDNPYDHGISAFASNGTSAVCIELTCLKNYDGDIENTLYGFLDGFTWH